MFIKHVKEDKLAIPIVYVDNIILNENYRDEIERLQRLLTREFDVKDFNFLKYFLIIELNSIYLGKQETINSCKIKC